MVNKYRTPEIEEFHVGFNQDLLFGESCDDNTSEWYVINANWGATKLCYSYCSEGDKLIHSKDTLSR